MADRCADPAFWLREVRGGDPCNAYKTRPPTIRVTDRPNHTRRPDTSLVRLGMVMLSSGNPHSIGYHARPGEN